MAQAIRQEINILDGILSAAGGSSATSDATVNISISEYDGATYYFEVVADSTVSISFTVTLRRKGTTTDDATCTIPVLTTAYTRIRSASFTPQSGGQDYVVFIDATAGATKNVHSARVIVLQSNPTKTDTFLEIGNQETGKTNTAAAALTNPKYWLYTAANWDGSPQFNALVTWKTSAANTTTITLQEDNGSFASWADKITIVNALTGSASSTLTRSSVFTPTDGRHYRISSKGSTTKSNYSIYNAYILVTTGSTFTNVEPQFLMLNTADSNATGLQTYQTQWNSSEWDAGTGTITYKHSMDSDNASNSIKLRDITAPADITNGTVTGANQQISSALGAFTNANALDTWVLNTTGVIAAGRILVIYAFVAAATTLPDLIQQPLVPAVRHP